MGTLWSSVKQIKAPYVFHREHGIPLYSTQRNQPSSLGEGEVSWLFLSCSRNLGYILELRWGWPFKTGVCTATSGLLSSCDGHLRNLNQAWQDNTDSSGGEVGSQASLIRWHSYIGIPNYIKKIVRHRQNLKQ